MILGINGNIKSGKDTVASIIQYLIALDKTNYPKTVTRQGYEDHDYTLLSGWDNKKFAKPIKDAVALWFGCDSEDLEDREFKESEIGDKWNKTVDIEGVLKDEVSVFFKKEDKLTYRKVMKLLGTECGREIIHPNIWVNILFRDFDDDNWIISDLRFPNELKAIKELGGVTIKVERYIERTAREQFDQHKSEGALGDEEFDYIIDNNGTKEELVLKVKTLLTDLKIIE